MSDVERLAGLLGEALADVEFLTQRVAQLERRLEAREPYRATQSTVSAVQTQPGRMMFTILEREGE